MITLVTGATGFIGSHVAERLVARGERVRALVRPRGEASPRSRANVRPLVERGLELVEGDLLDERSLDRALDGVMRVHHIAGLVSTRSRDDEKIEAANLRATETLWRACRRAKVERIVYLASIFALAGGDRAIADEESPYRLDDVPVPYFRAKRRAELHTREEAARGLPVVFAYPGYCLGPNDVYLSSMTVVDAFLRGQMVAYLDGGMAFVDVRDAAAGLDLAMERGAIGRRYLLTDHNLSWAQLFAELARITNRAKPRVRVPRAIAAALGAAVERVWPAAPLDRARAHIMGRHFWYDSSRARRELGWKGRAIEETLRDSIAWLRARPSLKTS